MGANYLCNRVSTLTLNLISQRGHASQLRNASRHRNIGDGSGKRARIATSRCCEATLQTLNSARALGGAGYGNDPALVPVVVRAVHVLVVRVVVIDLGVVQLVVRMRRIVPVLVRVSVIMVMRMAVGMLVHHVAMTVRMAVGVRMRVGVTMLVRMAVRVVVAMAMLVFAVRHFGPP